MARKNDIVGSGNLPEGLGQRVAEALAKAELARKIATLIAKRGLSQAAAADVLKMISSRCRPWSGAAWPGSRSPRGSISSSAG